MAKTMVLPSADKTRLAHFLLSKNILVANDLVWKLMVIPLCRGGSGMIFSGSGRAWALYFGLGLFWAWKLY
jgi:hypothetical protein